eukprot:ANDGO_00763.mRNA.1 Structural maintenance of chromosomes protein 6
MPPRKRVLHEEDEGKDEEAVLGGDDIASPVPKKLKLTRTTSSKRRKNENDGDDDESDSGSPDAAAPAEADMADRPVEFIHGESAHSSEHEDGEADDDDDDDDAEVRGINEKEDSDEDSDDGIPAGAQVFGKVAGRIFMIHAINFLCHDNLKIEFCPWLNVINGQNGSGKSAIVAALQICLGASSRIVERGASVSNMIKHGSDSASVSVVLLNRGLYAYRRKDYGPLIRVTRLIRRTGAPQYKLYNHLTNRVISEKKRDLEKILRRHNIQIDNPAHVITQEQSKKFLGGTSAKDRYKFFLEGTQLAAIRRDIVTISDTLSQFDEFRQVARNDYEQAKKVLADVTAEYNRSRTVRDLLRRKLELSIEFTAANRREKAEEVMKAEMIVSEIRAVIEEKSAKKRADEEEAQRLDEELRRYANQSSASMQEHRRIGSDLDQTHQSMNVLDRRIATIERQKKSAQREIDAHNENLRQFEQRAREQAQQQNEEGERRRQACQRRIDEAKLNLASAEQAVREHKEIVAGHRERLEQARDDSPLNSIDCQIREKEAEVNRLEGQLRDLQNSVPDRLRLVGGRLLATACGTIARNLQRFRQPPIGPIGFFLECDRPWSDVFQKMMSNLNTGWIVSCFQDEKLLRDFLGNSAPKNLVVIVANFRDREYNYADVQHPTFKSVIRFLENSLREHPFRYENRMVVESTIMNVLMDFRHPERSLICESEEEAKDIIYRRQPKNVVDAWLPNMSKIVMKGRSEGVQTSHFDNKFDRYYGRRSIQEDVQEKRAAISAIKQEITRLNENKQEVQQRLDVLRRALTEAESREAELRRPLVPLRTRIQNLERELRDVDAEMSSGQDSDQLIAAEQEEINVQQTTLARLRQEEATVNSSRTLLAEQREALKTRFDQIGEANSSVVARMEQLSAEVAKVTAEVAAMTRVLDTAGKALAEKEKIVLEGRRRIEEYNDSLSTSQTAEVSEEVLHTERSPAVVERELKVTAQRFQEAQRQTGAVDIQMIMSAMEGAQAEYARIKSVLEKLDREMGEIRNSIDSRKNKYKKLQQGSVATMRLDFPTLLSFRNYTGQLNFDHEKEELDIVVHMHSVRRSISGEDKSKGDTATLSGGEKSFSMVCFLLSMWKTCHAPFHVADEFDVFMDQVNRRVSCELMSQFAAESHQLQLILVTPDDISYFREDKTMKKFFLKAPREANQQSLDGLLRRRS